MKLNLGCGFNKKDGFINVDCEAICQPDVLHNLEITPWPFQDNQFDFILASHCLEHLGETRATYMAIIREMWRILKPGGTVHVLVPHPRHDNFLHDPTHVRVITPVGLAMFDQIRNIKDFEGGGQETKLGLFTGVDFEVTQVGHDLMDPWKTAHSKGEIPNDQLEFIMATQNNVCHQVQIFMKAHKPMRGAQWIASHLNVQS